MALVLTGAPALEPVTVAEAKAHLRVDGEAEDALIASLILTSRLHVEAALGLALISQSWTLQLDAWPQQPVLELQISPLQSVDEVRVISTNGDASVIPANQYLVDVASKPPRLVRRGTLPQPGQPVAGIEIDLTVGYGDEADDVPGSIRQALLLLVAHWHEHRDPIEIGSAEMAIPSVVSDLLRPFKVVRL